MHTPRTKTYLAIALKNWMATLRPEDIGFSDGFKIEYRNEEALGATLVIKDPSEFGSRFYQIKVKEIL